MIDLDRLIRDADPAHDLIIPEPNPADADRLSRKPRRPPWKTDALLAGISVAVALAVAATALTIGAHRHGTAGPGSTSGRSATGRLLTILGVLSRPQTTADRAAALELADQPAALKARIERKLAAEEHRLAARGLRNASLERELTRVRAQKPRAGAPDPQVRLAAVTPWGEQLILVPYRYGHTEALCLDSGTGGGDCGITAGSIEAGRAWSIEGVGRVFPGGSTATRVFIVVPDGVAKVAFVIPRQSPVAGGPLYGRSLTVLVPVQNNVAFAQVNRQCCESMVTRWYAADGRLIKVTGNPATTNRVSGPRPTPETKLSRAAERDPSTPNPVYVLPSSGGPSTPFKVQWRVLLSDADYQIGATGPNGTRCLGASDLIGVAGGGVNDVRGQMYAVTIGGARRSKGLCPGTYHISATLYDLGLAGGLRHPDRPFGTATFTVKR